MSKPAKITLGVFLAFLAVCAIALAIAIARFQPVARNYAISALRRQYHADVEMGDLHISLFPRVRASGENVVFRVPGHPDLPPLMSIRRFTIEARVIGFFRSPKRIRLLGLEGLTVHVPPRGLAHTGATAPASNEAQKPDVPLIFEQVIANGTTLEILPKDRSKEPLDFDIRELTLHHVGLRQAMTFHAKLTNPRPPGFIHSDGRFGPWQVDDPSDTPVTGEYTFRDADLSVFHGIAGTLSSNGKYEGQLDHIQVHGTADVPNFQLRSGHNPMPLRTTFDAVVDGMDGDTVLNRVRAILGDSAFEVSGAIERRALEKDKTISLEASGTGGRIQDFLHLAIGGKTPMTGSIAFRSHVRIPPGESDVLARLQLNGWFAMAGVKFTSPDVEEKLVNLSNHALGKPKAPDTGTVAAELAGQFRMRGGEIALPALNFEVPGAVIRLHGTYQVVSGAIDMRGEAKLQATVSQMTTGVKHILLKPLDPLFKRDGAGAVIPIKIGGTRGQPSFKLDIGRVFSRK